MEKSVVGKLGDDMDFRKLGEELVKGGMSMMRARFLGDNSVLLTPREGEVMEDIMKHNNEWFKSVFTSVSPWSVNSCASHKTVRVRCYGLPLPFWNKDCFTKVIGELTTSATLVSIDDSMLSWEILEFARVQVRLLNVGSIRMARRVRINKQI